MIHPWLAIALVLLAFGAWFVTGNLIAKAAPVTDEMARKFVHVGMGFTCLSFPWVFAGETWAVLTLGGICLFGLLLVRCVPVARERIGGCLHGIDRQSLGEIYFTVAIAVLFWWSSGDPILFSVPVLILTISDATGALVGVRYGKTSFATLSGFKSAEGSAMFFLTAFLSAHVPLLLFTSIGRAEVLVISLTLAAMVMLVEAISTGGIDNLLIPLGGFYLLSEYMQMELSTLMGRLVLVTVLLVLVLLVNKRSSLDGAARLGSVLFAYGCFALGGWPCFIPVVIVYLSHVLATRDVRKQMAPSHNLNAILSIAATGMLWLVLRPEDPVPPFTLGIVTHFTILSFNTLKSVRPERAQWLLLLQASAKAVGLSYGAQLIFMEDRANVLLQTALAFPVTIVATWLFTRFHWDEPADSLGVARWAVEAVIATAASAAVFLY